jgi:hypothetical protein
LDVSFHRLKDDVRQVDADDVESVAGQVVHLRPHEAASRAGLVLDDRVDRGTLLLEHDLLMASR